MGSGDKFRFGWLPKGHVSLGMAVARYSEHEWSIHVELILWQVYIGIGRGYEEFER